MSAHESNVPSPLEVLRVFTDYPKRWLGPTVAIAIAVGLFALVKNDTWEAEQALLVRNEAAAGTEGLGKFRSNDERRAIQETLLEMVKSRSVLGAALSTVGPADGKVNGEWPAAQDVADLADRVELAPPKGATFGTTDIVYLRVRDSERERAIRLASAISEHLVGEFQKLRGRSAESATDELTRSMLLAKEDARLATQQLAELERNVGADLGELRSLLDSGSGDGDLRRKALEIEGELRQAQLEQRNHQELVRLLTSAQEDHDRLLATPNRLLESQPALRRLKEGLVDAQLKTAELMGSKSAEHPHVQAAKASEQEIVDHLRAELDVAVRGAALDLDLSTDRVETLSAQLSEIGKRLDRIAAERAGYAKLVAEAAHRTRLLESAEQALAQATASQAGTEAASLITTIDEPHTGPSPAGLGRLPIVVLGLAAGFVAGCGILFLTVPSIAGAARVPTRTERVLGTPAAERHSVSFRTAADASLSLMKAR